MLRFWRSGTFGVDDTIKTLSIPHQPVGLHHVKEQENSSTADVCVLLKPAEGGGEIITKRTKSFKCNRFILQGPKKWQTVCFVPLMPPPQAAFISAGSSGRDGVRRGSPAVLMSPLQMTANVNVDVWHNCV